MNYQSRDVQSPGYALTSKEKCPNCLKRAIRVYHATSPREERNLARIIARHFETVILIRLGYGESESSRVVYFLGARVKDVADDQSGREAIEELRK